MPLDEYRRKRNFSRSPEPAGREGVQRRRAGGERARFFCVQKHLASHLHYDLRLEHDGVLLSWAVPKGPSLDPKTKRLAMKVEDHPLEYGSFEGVIPEGYGAGIVLLWDEGRWIPEVDDVGAAIRKGDLKFTLDGYKLKGSWVLVRTGGRGPGRGSADDRSWLLIKHRDDWAGPIDVTAFAPLSVKSGGDFEHVLAADRPDLWTSHRPAPARGGETGALLAGIIERAAAIKAGRAAQPSRTTRRPKGRTSKAGDRTPRKAKAGGRTQTAARRSSKRR